ncbi:MAG TPA: glycosyltransferase family 1 protein [Acidimicrobiales bacterium]|jgi:glycosyltransferase involved in cell wall biosynthesis|nr:glycosyltransferase family 1 protein [Acidimicrobiales bacterium]
MRVALDARRLQDRPYTGVGRIIAHLLPHLAREVEIVLLTDGRRESPAGGESSGIDFSQFEEVRLSVPGRLPEPFWLQGPVARWLRGFNGIFHGTYNAVPLAYRGTSVVSIYDLTWQHHPEDFGSATRLSFMTQARWSAHHSGAIITCSEYSRQDIVDTYQVAAERVFNVPPAVDPAFSPDRVAGAPAVLSRVGLRGPYVVAMGGAKRRGLEVAVEAWRRLPPGTDRPSLVVLGAEVPPAEPGLVHAGRLSDDDWSAVLAGALAFCYPTRFEGYGMPALEAAASGVPVVCARIGPLPEVLGEAAEWCASPGADDIAVGLARVVADPARREQLRVAGLARAAAAPTWEQSAKVALEAYAMAAGSAWGGGR